MSTPTVRQLVQACGTGTLRIKVVRAYNVANGQYEDVRYKAENGLVCLSRPHELHGNVVYSSAALRAMADEADRNASASNGGGGSVEPGPAAFWPEVMS